MIMAEVGSSLNVDGSKRAKVATGPIPGKTPINVPIRHPTRQKKRFMGRNATEKPVPR
jgi:hypothetical protein